MKTFAHYMPESVDEAVELLVEHRGKARINAGGTDLLGVLKDDIHPAYPQAIVSLKKIASLHGIKIDNAGLSVSAMTSLAELAESFDMGVPVLLAQAARSVGTPQLRAMGTAGGNLLQEVRCWYYRYPRHLGGPVGCRRKGGKGCPALNGDNRHHSVMPARACVAAFPSDLAVALTALDAELRVVGPEGARTVPVAELYSELGPVLAVGDVMTEIWVPRPGDDTHQLYRKHAARTSIDFAEVSLAAVVEVRDRLCTSARLALGGVAPVPLRASAAEAVLLGRPLEPATASQAAEALLAQARPLARNAWKLDLARALIRESLVSLAP
jgi:xanthine dehydrogenase YagS FAD-binding subunit